MAAGRRIFLAYLVYFSAIGASFPYLPVFYRDLGLRLEEIGLLTAIQAATQLVLGPIWGGLVDRFPKVGLTLPLAAAVAAAGGFILFLATDFPSVLAGSVLLFAGLAGIGPTLDARTLETLRPNGRDRYGQVRAFGSLAFVVMTLLVGLLLDARGAAPSSGCTCPACSRPSSSPPRSGGEARTVRSACSAAPATSSGRRACWSSSAASRSSGRLWRGPTPSIRSRSSHSVAAPRSSASPGRSAPSSRSR